MKCWGAWFVGALALVMLGACVTTAPHILSVDDVRALRLERMELVLEPAAPLQWFAIFEAFAKSHKGKAASEADLKAYAAERLREKAHAIVEPPLRSTLAGTRPVNARITVHALHIPHFGEFVAGFFIGGPPSSSMSVSVDFVDARTGASVVAYPRTQLSTDGGYKVEMGTTGLYSADPIERMMTGLGNRLTAWLLKL